MKKIIVVVILAAFQNMFSQNVIIGDNTGTATNKTNVLLEFSKAQNKGIIVPYITTLPTSPAEGTIILDCTTPTNSRLKYYNGSWVDWSGVNGDSTTALNAQNSTTEATNAKVIIGAGTSDADGILVLESTTKSMVLPQVSDVSLIPNPAPGMMVYINKTGAKRLAVFNGTYWSFWRP